MQKELTAAIQKKMGQNLRHVIGTYYTNQTEAAHHWGISQGTVSRIWRGKDVPGQAARESIKKSLNVTDEELARSDFEEFYRAEKGEELNKSIVHMNRMKPRRRNPSKAGKKAEARKVGDKPAKLETLVVVAEALGLNATVLKGGIFISEPG